VKNPVSKFAFQVHNLRRYTSGLDSTIALRLADTLAVLARDKGRTGGADFRV
jgi:hypothetical protein